MSRPPRGRSGNSCTSDPDLPVQPGLRHRNTQSLDPRVSAEIFSVPCKLRNPQRNKKRAQSSEGLKRIRIRRRRRRPRASALDPGTPRPRASINIFFLRSLFLPFFFLFTHTQKSSNPPYGSPDGGGPQQVCWPPGWEHEPHPQTIMGALPAPVVLGVAALRRGGRNSLPPR